MNASRKKICVVIFSVLAAYFWSPAGGSCHRVNIFCWVEGNQVKCESRFTPGGPVKSGSVEVYSQQTGERLLTTRIDKNGRTVFDIPEAAKKHGWDLKVHCSAEMGHGNSWVVKADEFASDEKGGFTVRAQGPLPEKAMSSGALEKMFSRVLSDQLTPIKRDLAELKVRRISFQDILGGLGYILGITGIVFYFLAGKERD